jgi:hypothetical protein
MRKLLMLLLCGGAVSSAAELYVIWEGTSFVVGFSGVADSDLQAYGNTVYSRRTAESGSSLYIYVPDCESNPVAYGHNCTAERTDSSDYRAVDVHLADHPTAALWIFVDGPTNDMLPGVGDAEVQSRLLTYFSKRTTACAAIGRICKFATSTIFPRWGVPSTQYDAELEATRIAYNQRIRNGCSSAQAVYANAWGGKILKCSDQSLYKYVVDLASDSRLGDYGDNLDLTYFENEATHVHLNSTGSAIVADFAARAINDSVALTGPASAVSGGVKLSGGVKQ